MTPSSSPTIDQGQSVNVTVSVSDNSPITWSLQTGFGKPQGTLSNQTPTSATYTAPAIVTSKAQVTIVATAGTMSAALGVFIEPPPQVTGTSSPTASSCPPNGSIVLASSDGTKVVGQTLSPGDFKLIEAGGVAPYTWSVASGTLPAGTTLEVGSDTSSPSIVGAPITPGCSSFAVQVTDAAGISATSNTLNLVIIPPALKVNARQIGHDPEIIALDEYGHRTGSTCPCVPDINDSSFDRNVGGKILVNCYAEMKNGLRYKVESAFPRRSVLDGKDGAGCPSCCNQKMSY